MGVCQNRLDGLDDGVVSASGVERRSSLSTGRSSSLKSKIPRLSLPRRPNSSAGIFPPTDQKVCAPSPQQISGAESNLYPQSRLPGIGGKWKEHRTMHSSFSSVSSAEYGNTYHAVENEDCGRHSLDSRKCSTSPSQFCGKDARNLSKIPSSSSPFSSTGYLSVPRCSSALGLSVRSSTNDSAWSQTIETTRSGPSYMSIERAQISPIPMYARKRNTKGLSPKMKKSFAEFDVGRL